MQMLVSHDLSVAINILTASNDYDQTDNKENITCIALSLSLSDASGSSSPSELLSWKRGSSCHVTFTGFIVSSM